ncbi:RNA 2',3'-cyclic phosphodiesterase [Actinoplanes sp. N902-109]|uniref:RNA 2',3'-cyclic phosphodiesterase n=1 Tax=Actinoplanes sp. (strain N902-109) TaxID=649831 RepID=UPI000688B217|nr:RNA 2',3'-cyclic phosphodiesterase [Actinoplanes sp. N902-109]
MRLFVAIYPPSDVLGHLRAHLDAAVAGRRVRLTRPEKWHVTLAFFGEVGEERLPGLMTALATVPVPVGLPLRLRGGGSFGNRVTWVGVDGDLLDLAARTRAVTGVADDRPFQAHLTVLYAHDRAVSAALAGYAGPAWAVDRIELVRSEPDGTYTTLASVGQELSRAAGPPPNSTSSQLGSRLRGFADSSASGSP